MTPTSQDRFRIAGILPRLAAALLALLVVGFGSSCGGGGSLVGPEGPLMPGHYYTQYPMFMNGDRIPSTNFRRGTGTLMIPINTQVELTGQSGRRLNMILDGSRPIRFEHRPKDTLDTMEEAFGKAFGHHPVDLSGLTPEVEAALAAGTATVGMDREMVLMIEGPPPARFTLSLDGNIWNYREHGWNRSVNLTFGPDGHVSSITH